MSNKTHDLLQSSNLTRLPVEIKLKLLKYLPTRDLRSIIRVNRTWRQVGDDPVLWRDVPVKISSRASGFISDILTSSRLSLLRDVKLEQCVTAKTAESVIRLIIKHGNIQSLDVSGSKLSLVECQTMGELTLVLTKLVAQSCRLTKKQLDRVFQVIDQDQSCKMKILMIGNNDLRGIKSDNLGNAVSKLSSFHCDNCSLSDAHLTNILTSLGRENENSKLEELNLLQNSLITINHSLIASGLAKLKSANLWGTDAICFSLFNAIIDGRSRIEKLNLGNSDFSYYPPSLVASSVCRVKEANLSHATMNGLHLNMILTTVVTNKDCRLESLTMLNLNRSLESSVPEILMQQVKEKIPKFELSFV